MPELGVAADDVSHVHRLPDDVAPIRRPSSNRFHYLRKYWSHETALTKIKIDGQKMQPMRAPLRIPRYMGVIERNKNMNKLSKYASVGLVAVLASLSIAACSSSSSKKADTAPVATIAALSGNSTSVKLDAGFTTALTSLGLTPGVLGTATLTDGSVHFPITGGHVTVYKKGAVDPYVQGDVQHNGSGLSLTAGATTVQLQNFDINPGNSQLYGDVSVNGTVAASHADLFNLDGSTLEPITITGGVATLTGTRVLVSDTAAGLLDKVFNTTAVKGGLLVGIATILAK
jgi:hypothetical protein